jgi:hypothetical protein
MGKCLFGLQWGPLACSLVFPDVLVHVSYEVEAVFLWEWAKLYLFVTIVVRVASESRLAPVNTEMQLL